MNSRAYRQPSSAPVDLPLRDLLEEVHKGLAHNPEASDALGWPPLLIQQISGTLLGLVQQRVQFVQNEASVEAEFAETLSARWVSVAPADGAKQIVLGANEFEAVVGPTRQDLFALVSRALGRLRQTTQCRT